MKVLKEKLSESLASVLPIAAIVLALCISVAPISPGVLVLYIFGTLLVIFGMGLFTLGSTLSMTPLGEGIGVQLSKAGKKAGFAVALIVCFLLGSIITISEPDLTVLATQIPSIPNLVLILSVAVGVGGFLLLSMLRTRFSLKLSWLLIISYSVIFILAIFTPGSFIPAAFDSGGVTTGPMTVPFIMALGAGMTTLQSQKKTEESGFGLVALCSVGPILSVMILSICFKPEATTTQYVISDALTTREAFLIFAEAIPVYAKDVLIAISPLLAVFVIFEIIFRRFKIFQLLRMTVGFIYTFAGLVIFLLGANVGFMPAGNLIGSGIAEFNKYLLIPVGMVIGYFVVAAEPAVHVLKKQVEDVTEGTISQKTIGLSLSIGVAISIGLSMLRIVYEIPIIPFLLAGYAISLGISFFVPPLYTGIAFDSGGVASGPMTSTFILPFAVGACTSLGGNVLTEAFGIVAMVAMTPLITIQIVGLVSKIRVGIAKRRMKEEIDLIDDSIVYYDDFLVQNVRIKLTDEEAGIS